MTIVRTTYRYKRPPRKRPPAVALEGPAIITIRDKERGARVPQSDDAITSVPAVVTGKPSVGQAAMPEPTNVERKSAIVTIRRRKYAHLADPLEMTPEEHKR